MKKLIVFIVALVILSTIPLPDVSARGYDRFEKERSEWEYTQWRKHLKYKEQQKILQKPIPKREEEGGGIELFTLIVVLGTITGVCIFKLKKKRGGEY